MVDAPGQSAETPTNKCASGENAEAGKSIGHPAAIRPKSQKVSPDEEPRGGPPKHETQKNVENLAENKLGIRGCVGKHP